VGLDVSLPIFEVPPFSFFVQIVQHCKLNGVIFNSGYKFHVVCCYFKADKDQPGVSLATGSIPADGIP
jgi:hypothetical protein